MNSNARYDGKPLLRVLDLYVLWAIGELPPDQEDGLKRMAPKLQARFGGGGQWHEAIELAVRIEPDTLEQIRGMWARNLEIARANGLTLSPEEFAMMVVDSNFPLD
jgi:hypothetical protein